MGYGEVLAMLHFESRDVNVAVGTVYLNSLAGDAGLSPHNTAVGLGQISYTTAPAAGLSGEDRYDAMKNIKGVITLIFAGAVQPACKFKGVGAFSAFTDYHNEIFHVMGPKINKEIGKTGSYTDVDNSVLKSILGIP